MHYSSSRKEWLCPICGVKSDRRWQVYRNDDGGLARRAFYECRDCRPPDRCEDHNMPDRYHDTEVEPLDERLRHF
ncbi:MAG: hypothetical protein A3E78_12630 [Alphaproteobacteria bacterium RIFCSPHIGHO2_12_FULL_63_12]|nr:MAG: hypothetical protein A3E78_12630 [Alphaproteobacteria bacterium RIFCSPHIGHO2_12_FULL_63_12]